MKRSRVWTRQVEWSLVFASTVAACGARVSPIDEPAGSGGEVAVGGVSGAGAANCAAQLPSSLLGRWIAFDSDRVVFRRQLYMMHPDQSGLTQLLSDSYNDKEPVFSPDGMLIAFTSDRARDSQVFLLDLATGDVTQVTSRPDGADEPSFSRDGALIAFHSGASVWVIAPDGTQERLVATGLDTFNAYFWPQFSADGTELVLDRNNEIDAVKVDGTGLRRIVQNSTTTIKAPSVSPDGQDVAYQVDCDAPGSSIWTTPFSTTTNPCKGRRVTPTDDYYSERPVWASSTLLTYEQVHRDTNVASLAIISRESGSIPCVITPDTADYRNPSW